MLLITFLTLCVLRTYVAVPKETPTSGRMVGGAATTLFTPDEAFIGMPGFGCTFSQTSQCASALAFISRSISALTWVVSKRQISQTGQNVTPRPIAAVKCAHHRWPITLHGIGLKATLSRDGWSQSSPLFHGAFSTRQPQGAGGISNITA